MMGHVPCPSRPRRTAGTRPRGRNGTRIACLLPGAGRHVSYGRTNTRCTNAHINHRHVNISITRRARSLDRARQTSSRRPRLAPSRPLRAQTEPLPLRVECVVIRPHNLSGQRKTQNTIEENAETNTHHSAASRHSRPPREGAAATRNADTNSL